MSPIFIIQEHLIPASHIREYARATSHAQDERLLIHVKQYVPKDNPVPRKGDISIVGGHANGFPKEVYEPLWEDLYVEAKSRGIRIRSIYMADAAWQGQSGILNSEALGNDPSWLDHARDILHIINTLRPPPPLVGIGHSFGASILVNAALMHARLFTLLILIDPVISRFTGTPTSAGPAAASVNRRDSWPSREEAKRSFQRNPFYKSWDTRVLKRWVKYGLTNLPGREEVTLTTTKHQEVFTYVRPSSEAYDLEGKQVVRRDLVPDLDTALNEKWPTYPVYRPEGPRTLAALPSLRPSVLYIFGGQSEISTLELRNEKLALTGAGVGGSGGVESGRVKGVVIASSGHLVPLEVPGLCMRAAVDWIGPALEQWWAEERAYESWTRRPAPEKRGISSQLERDIKQMRSRGV